MHYGAPPLCGFTHWYGKPNLDLANTTCEDCINEVRRLVSNINTDLKRRSDLWYKRSNSRYDEIIKYKNKCYRWDGEGTYGVAVLQDMNTGDIIMPSVHDINTLPRLGRIYKCNYTNLLK